jgi:DNA-directed RNA polymerase specialized sigma24 family protein
VTAPTYSSPLDRTGRRREFTDFYGATYPAVVGELFAFSGNLDLAHAVAGVAYARAWQAWPAVRALEWPVMWVRSDGVRRLRRPPRAQRLFEYGLTPVEPVRLHPEDEVLLGGLQRLPASQRLPLVLHYMAQVPASAIAEWFGGTVDDAEDALDGGFDALVAMLEWSDLDIDDALADGAEDDVRIWTADALEDCAHRLRTYLPTPVPTLVFRRATVKKVARRGAPASAAAAACIALVAWLSPGPASTAEAAAFGPPPTLVERPHLGEALPDAMLGSSATAPSARIARVAGATVTTGAAQLGPSVATVPAASTVAATTGTANATTTTTASSTTPTTISSTTAPTTTAPTKTSTNSGSTAGEASTAADDPDTTSERPSPNTTVSETSTSSKPTSTPSHGAGSTSTTNSTTSTVPTTEPSTTAEPTTATSETSTRSTTEPSTTPATETSTTTDTSTTGTTPTEVDETTSEESAVITTSASGARHTDDD